MRLLIQVLSAASLAAAVPFALTRQAPDTCGESIAFIEDTDDFIAKSSGPSDDQSLFAGRTEAAAEELPLMGCSKEHHALRDAEIEGAHQAVGLEEEPGSIGAVFQFDGTRSPNSLVRRWIARWAPQSVENRPDSDGVIGTWVNRMWRLPDGSVVNAMYPENKTSGSLCLIRANVAVLKPSLATLNNWCTNRLGWWRKR